MNNNEKKPDDLFERLKGGSVFSFLKAADAPPGGVPLTKPEPLNRPESFRQPQDVPDLKKRLAELEAKIKQLEADAAKPASAPVQDGALEFYSGIEKRLAGLESRLAAAPEKPAPAPDLEEKLKQMFENAEGGIRTLLEEYRSSGEEKSAKVEELAKELGREAEADRQANSDGAAELCRRLKALEGELGETLAQFSGALERALKEGENALKNLLADERGLREKSEAEAAGRLEKLEQEAARGRQETASALAALSRQGEETNSSLGEAHKALEISRERGESLEFMLKENENAIKTLLAEERGLRGKSEAEAAGRLEKLEQEPIAFKAAVDKVNLDMLLLKEDVLESTNKALNDGHERLEALAGKMQGDIMATAGDKFSTLRSTWEAAAVEIHNAQKTAYCALEKCERLEKSLFFLDLKTGALERKYSRYIAEPPKPGDSEKERQEKAF